MKLEPITQLSNMMSGGWRQFGVHVFQGKITLDDMTRIEVNGTVWHRKNPGKVAEMVIIFPSEARLNDEERQRMAGIVKRWEKVRTASATVVLAAGLVGSLHRSILTGMHMLAPPPHPTKVFSATADAVGWMLPHIHAVCGTDVEGDELVAAIEDFCTTFQAMRSSG